MEAHTCLTNTQETVAGFCELRTSLGYNYEFQATLGYRIKPGLQNKQTNRQTDRQLVKISRMNIQ